MITIKLIRTLTSSYLVSSLLLLSTVFSAQASEDHSPFEKIVCFGDSLCDTGNLYIQSGYEFPPAPYYQGRASNGLLWNEYLAQDLNSQLILENNYAYFGAKTDDTNYNSDTLPYPFIGLTQQVDQYLESIGNHRTHPRTLILIGIGANDFFDFLLKGGALPIPDAISNMLAELKRLLSTGARHIALLNVPDLSQTPAFASSTPLEKAQLSGLCFSYNTMLAAAVEDLKSEYDFKLTIVDAYSIINQIIANRVEFGLFNTSIPATFGVDPTISLFWDGVHPTTVGHRILADFAIEALIETYTAPQGVPFAESPLFFPASIVGSRN